MMTYGIIPARFGSSRFPGKPLADIAGKPLIARTLEAAGKAKSLDIAFVATDDRRIADAVEAYGGKAVMTPSELPSGTDRIACAADAFARETGGSGFGDDDILVNIQGDEPLVDPALIDALAGALRSDPGLDMATAEAPIHEKRDVASRSVVKVVTDRAGNALYFSRSPVPCVRDGECDPANAPYLRHIGIYAYRGGFLRRYVSERQCELEKAEKLEQLRALWMGAKIATVAAGEDAGVGVDTPEDAERVGRIFRERGG